MPTIDDLIDTALGQQPTKFAATFDAIMGDKATAAIESMRDNIAQGIYAADEDDTDQDDVQTDDDIDGDIDDDEFDDIDDLDDEDFEDIDLEGIEDGEDA